jgi:hypothetical protein
VPPVRFEPTISAGKRAKTYALELATTETVHMDIIKHKMYPKLKDHKDKTG